MTAPQPGWYPNPDGSADLRYWDGQSWTDNRRAAPGGAVPGEQAEQSVTFPPVAPPAVPSAAPPAATDPVTPVNETIQFTEPPPGEPEQHETMQFPPAPPEPELSATDTMVFPDPASQPSAPPPPPPVAPPPPPAAAPPPPPSSPGSAGLPPGPPVQGSIDPTGYGVDVPAGFTPPITPAPTYYPAAATQPVVTGSNSGVAIAALVLGIVAALLSVLCGALFFLAVPAGIVAAVLGFVGLNQANKLNPPGPKAMAISGIVLGIAALVISAGWFVLLVAAGSASSSSGF